MQTIIPVGSTVTALTDTAITSLTLTRPAGVQAGDLILATVAGSTGTVPAVPTDWAAWEPQVAYGPNMRVINRLAAAGDPASWEMPVPSAKWCAVVTAWRGVDPTTPKDAPSATASATTVAFPAVPGITTVTPGAVVLAFGGTIGASGDQDIDWTTDGTIRGEATGLAAATGNPACVVTSRPAATAGSYTPTLAPVEPVTRGGVLVTSLRPAPDAAPAPVPLVAPTGLTVTPASSTRLNLTWSAVTGATGYDIERDGLVIASGVAGTSYSDRNLGPSTTYSYQVRSVG